MDTYLSFTRFNMSIEVSKLRYQTQTYEDYKIVEIVPHECTIHIQYLQTDPIEIVYVEKSIVCWKGLFKIGCHWVLCEFTHRCCIDIVGQR